MHRVVAADGMGLDGSIVAIVRDARGRFVRRYTIRNKTNNNARAFVAQWLTATSNITGSPGAVPGPSQMQLGTGTGSPAATDAGLFTAAAGTLVSLTNQSVYQTYYAQWIAYWGSSTPAGNYTEVVLLDAANNCWAHVLLQTSSSQPYVPISAGQTLTVIWKFNVLGN